LKGCLTNIILTTFLGGMFYFYYLHISKKFVQDEKNLLQRLQQADDKNKELAKMIVVANSSESVLEAGKKYQKIVLNEAKQALELIGVKNFFNIKITKGRLLLVVQPDVNLIPIRARYGAQAFYRVSKENIKIAIDLRYLIKNSKINSSK
jgi:hypothetical protein